MPYSSAFERTGHDKDSFHHGHSLNALGLQHFLGQYNIDREIVNEIEVAYMHQAVKLGYIANDF
jgi:hypothetical protein